MQAYIHTKQPTSKPGMYDCYQTVSVPVKETETPRHGINASGYGCKIPTQYMVKYNGRWRRVYAICYSNAATLFIGRKYTGLITVDIER